LGNNTERVPEPRLRHYQENIDKSRGTHINGIGHPTQRPRDQKSPSIELSKMTKNKKED